MSALVEDYLLGAARWVSATELCARFGVDQRALRADHGRPGLCTDFAISGNEGYRHVATATADEVEEFYRRGRKHSIAQLVRLRRLLRVRRCILEPRVVPPAVTLEGQFMLGLLKEEQW